MTTQNRLFESAFKINFLVDLPTQLIHDKVRSLNYCGYIFH